MDLVVRRELGKRGVARKKKKGTGCERYRTYYEQHVWEGERESQRERAREGQVLPSPPVFD